MNGGGEDSSQRLHLGKNAFECGRRNKHIDWLKKVKTIKWQFFWFDNIFRKT
jgi:hypothetical protein